MPFSRFFVPGATLGLTLLATSATAELAAAQVWQDWRSYMQGMGYVVDAAETTSGDTLTVDNISIEIDGGPDLSEIILRTGPIRFVQDGEDSVLIELPAQMPLTLDLKAEDTDAPSRVEMSLDQNGHSMRASGEAAAISYTYTAAQFGLILKSLDLDGVTLDPAAAQFSLTAQNVQSTTVATIGAMRSYVQNLSVGGVTYDMSFNAPEETEAVVINSTTGAVAFSGTSTLPAAGLETTAGIGALLAEGFAFDGTFETTGTETKVEVTSDEGVSKIKTGAASSVLTVAMGMGGLLYEAQARDVQMGAQLAGLPFPLFAEMASTGFNIRAPLAKSDTAQDFALAFDMTDFTMSDIIWALFDPAGQLPRAPATVALDLSGKAKVLFDTFDPQAIEEMAQGGASAGELEALKLDRLTVDAIGAKLDATGDLVFDNTDTTTLPGFPKPVGTVNVDLAGANGLLDTLVAMGILPSDQVMGARMMMGIFTVPGDAPDTLSSVIEFNEAGQILANGQRIK